MITRQSFFSSLLLLLSISAYAQNYVDVAGGDGHGFRFWNGSNNYKIHMGNSSLYHYGPVTDYSIKMNMNDNNARGWTWGKYNETPIAALNTQGNFQIAGHFAVGTQRVISTSSSAIAIGDLLGGDGQRELVLRAGDQDRLKITNNGSIGIGIMIPEVPFHMEVDAATGAESILKYEISDAPGDHFRIGNATGIAGQFIPSLRAHRTSDNRQVLFVGGTIETEYDIGENPVMVFDSRISSGPIINRPLFSWTSYLDTKMTLLANGSLGIGTQTTGDHKLAVDGSIGAREVRVETDNWPDYVFEAGYNLRSIEEVENFILENNHLPEIPNATEVEADGVNLGEMNARLLEKIEELTLYLIEQNKQNQALQERVEQLENQFQKIDTKR